MEGGVTNETITLVLGDVQAEVDKQKLAYHSQYFTSLFSHGFKDSEEKEHILNYQIESHVVQDFANWINNDEYSKNHPFERIKLCMIKFLNDRFKDLMSLLRLGIILTADSLTDDVTYIIVQYWLHPDKVIDIWLLAEELGSYVLRDICVAVCLDRFSELPISLLVHLSKDNFTKLIGNVNIRCTKEYLCRALDEWALHNSLATPEKIDVPMTRKPEFIRAMLVYLLDASGTKKPWLYSWDGVTLLQIVELKDVRKYLSRSSTKALMGMRVTGRGYNIYMIGGEFGLGTGHFNKMIWRYCLISKQWYYQASLPIPRRHMVAAFVKNKLFLVGGVGQHRLKLSSVDILDIYTGTEVCRCVDQGSAGPRMFYGSTEFLCPR
ncbi:hypothetical protein KM043_000911 [Ampulex compressa]|nr:hypothetical protein KM043_000911 [Ampulex compressa]